MREVQLAAGGRQVAPTFPLSVPIQTLPIQTLPIQTLPIQTLPGWGGVGGGGWIFCTAFTCLGGGWGSAPFMNLPIQTLPIPSENAGGATCRRRAASCTDISTYRCPFKPCPFKPCPFKPCRGGVGWGGDGQSLSEG